MNIQKLKAQVRSQPGLAIIDLSGELTAAANVALNAAHVQAEIQNPAMVLLNFAGVSHIDSSGIGLILNLLARTRQSQRSLIAYGLSSRHEQIFKLIGLAPLMNILPDEVSALAAVPISA